MEKIITQCSHCEAKFKLGNDKVGKKIRCPKCKGIFVVQGLAEKAQPAPKAQAAPQAAPTPKPASPPKSAPAAPVAEAPSAAAADKQEPAAQEVVPLKNRPRPLQVKDFFETQHTRFIPEKSEGVNAHISYEITGEGGGKWTLVVNSGTCEIREGPDPAAKTHVKMTSKTYLKLAQGKLDGRVGYMLGKIKIKGDKQSVATVRECFRIAEV